jgi:hypothetical protein
VLSPKQDSPCLEPRIDQATWFLRVKLLDLCQGLSLKHR